ncbi:S8 family serine peptidase [Lysobacter sp. Root983]|uniref:S8 family serine peptidase n=1 Tax=Lysobacter sp. Root983 TaxID=1736613 RepID=UPI0009E7A498|nr:S8 family serine peptidase [Lysobacter sp. Root983]
MNRRILSVTIGASLVCAALPGLAAELLTVDRPVEGRYIVVLKEPVAGSSARSATGVTMAQVPSVARSMATQHRAKLLRSYQHVLRGFVVDADDAALAQLLKDPRVAYVEEDGVGSIYATQNNATWGIDRVDQRNLPLSTTYTYDTDATGVHAYILDTGVRADHTEFSGRMGNGFSVRPGDPSTNDCHGHGTHVAGTVAGTTRGVAKKATVHPVRVFDCTGNALVSETIAAIDWVAANHVKPAVANMSFGYPGSTAIDNSITNLIDAGVVVVAASGNSNDDACTGSPRRVPRALTVAATDLNDARSLWPNGQAPGWGSCVDLFAPGSDIVSAGISSSTSTATMSGTSMATPHVAGVVALYLSTHPAATPDEVHAAIMNNATPGKVTGNLRGSPNFLLHSLFSAGPGNQAPVANFTSSASGLTVSFTDTSTDSDGSIASRSWNFGDGGTSTATNPSRTYAAAGTYTVTLTVTDNSGATNTKTSTVTVGGTGGTQTYSNTADVNIPDNNATGASSTITVSGRSGNAPSTAKVSVNVQHTFRGDLIVDLIAPDGSVYNLFNRPNTNDGTDHVIITDRVVNLSSEPLNGAWKLRVADRAQFDTGYINSWSVTF